MKKIMLTTLIASMLLLPLGSTALADYEEAPAPAVSQDYLPGDMPAGTSPADAMAPALHGVLLAMMNHDVQSLDLSDGVLAWECLYNMLSLYGQLDSRSQMEDGLLLFPTETVQDYAAALDLSLEALPPLPQELTDRLTFDRGGNVVIPSFAVGRTQELLYFLRRIKVERLVKGHEDFPVYVDSPLAVEATEIFQENRMECFAGEALELVKEGINPISFAGLKLSITSDESREINFIDTPKVIISASGMCEAGRIRHHLKHNLWRPECTILFVGYQAVGTLGRMIVDGVDEVKLFGESIQVRAEIKKLVGMSGHADKNGLIEWVCGFQEKPRKIFVVHGEDSVCAGFAECLKMEYGQRTYAPYSGTVFDLLSGKLEYEAMPVPVKKKAKSVASAVYARLLAAAQRLLNMVKGIDGMPNKDMGKFADQINSLCDKWER